jgi:hypothetical protein
VTTKKNRSETEAKINARAWKDPAFKKKLLSKPHEALQELGMKNIPTDLKIKIVEEEKNSWCIVLHAPPENASKLSESELSKVAAAGICGICDSPGTSLTRI